MFDLSNVKCKLDCYILFVATFPYKEGQVVPDRKLIIHDSIEFFRNSQ